MTTNRVIKENNKSRNNSSYNLSYFPEHTIH